MRIVTNVGLVKSRRRMATISAIGGLAILGLGLYLSLTRPELVLYAYACLIAGTIVSWIGVALSDQWVRPPRADIALESALKGAGRGFVLYNWALPADHVILSPAGLTVLAVFNQDGQMIVQGEKWREVRPLIKRLTSLGRRPVRNPERWLESDVESLRRALADVEPELADVEIGPAAVFTFPNVELEVEEPSVPTLRYDELRDWLRDEAKEVQLSPARRRRLEKALDEMAAERID